MATDKSTAPTADDKLAEALNLIATMMAKQDKRAETEDLNTEDARRAGRRVGASGAYENAFPPDFSAFNPKGERDNPRPELRCKMIWVGFKLAKEALTVEEINLLNQAQPGDYRVEKADGRTIPFTIGGKADHAGRLEMLTFHFPCKSTEDRHNHLSMANYLKQVLAQQAA